MQQNSIYSENGKPFFVKENKAQSRQSASGLGDAKDVSFSFLATICEVISEAGCWNTEIILVWNFSAIYVWSTTFLANAEYMKKKC